MACDGQFDWAGLRDGLWDLELCLKEKQELLSTVSTAEEKWTEELEVLAKHNRDERDRMGLTGPHVFIKTLDQEWFCVSIWYQHKMIASSVQLPVAFAYSFR